MTVHFVGSGDDAHGFALAGAVVHPAATRDELRRALDALAALDPPPGLVLVSRAARDRAPHLVDDWHRDPRRPPLTVL
ncbi:MAG: V-type ATP synthase subunit F [Acidobacteriota bacterium]